MRKYKVVDLFCGCGGFSEGFKNSGCDIVLGVDNWEPALLTYKHNFPNATVLKHDLSEISIEKIMGEADLTNIDIIIGGPPCQGFSVSGKRLIDDPRNKLYKAFVHMVDVLKPKAFVMENVPGMKRLFGGKVHDKIIRNFSQIGYNVKAQQLSSDEYGVPQKRRRVFFVGLCKDKVLQHDSYKFPEPTHGAKDGLKPVITSKEAISDLDFIGDSIKLDEVTDYQLPISNEYQAEMVGTTKKLFNHVTTLHKEETKRIISLVPDGGNYKNLPDELKETRKVNIAWTRMNSKKACFTIDTGHNHHFHYSSNRVPTVRESARIQSFKDEFRFLSTKTNQLKQVGNAVPPKIAEVIANGIVDIFDKE